MLSLRFLLSSFVTISFYTELPLKVSKLKCLQASLAEKKIQCEQLTQQAVSLTEELTALDTTANTHRVAFEAQNALRMEEVTTLTATYEKTRLHKDAKYQELQALQNQKGTWLFCTILRGSALRYFLTYQTILCVADTLDTEVAAGEAALRAITLTLRQEQATEEKLRTEVHHLDTKVQAIREELSAARAASEQAATGITIFSTLLNICYLAVLLGFRQRGAVPADLCAHDRLAGGPSAPVLSVADQAHGENHMLDCSFWRSLSHFSALLSVLAGGAADCTRSRAHGSGNC